MHVADLILIGDDFFHFPFMLPPKYMHCALDVHRGAKNQFRNFKLTKKKVARESISKKIKNQEAVVEHVTSIVGQLIEKICDIKWSEVMQIRDLVTLTYNI